MEFDLTQETARKMDDLDALGKFRNQFHIPVIENKQTTYFCGNSLGLQPVSLGSILDTEMEAWKNLGVEGHFKESNPWFSYHTLCKPGLAALTGAESSEVIAMNSLTTNLHLLLISFYRPTNEKYKIIMEGGAFPSDQFAMESQIRLHGFDPEQAIIRLNPKPGEYILNPDDILYEIEQHHEEINLILLGAVHFYTGQFFDLQSIVKCAHQYNIPVGFDLAHAIGNVPLDLHDWEIDFAVWCSYKYLNSGPGGVGGAFVHERHGDSNDFPRLAGWWGHKEGKRFLANESFNALAGVDGWQLSNVNVISTAIHLASLKIFMDAGIKPLREKSKRLTAYLVYLLKSIPSHEEYFQILTPEEPEQRGAQISIFMRAHGEKTFDALIENGVICDWRAPNVIRVAPVPLYNTFLEVYKFVACFKRIVKSIQHV